MSNPDPISPEPPPESPPGIPSAEPGPGPAAAPLHAHAGPRVLCPYCGVVQPVTARCASCKGLLDPESRQATQNAMGPWQVRNPTAAFHPGCSYPTLREMVRRGKVTRETILRGPTTAQFWSMAANTPGVAVLLGECHACHQPAREDEYLCRHCGVVLSPRTDRQHLGLGPVRPVGIPMSQPPVVSSAPQSAFSASPSSAPALAPDLAPGSTARPAPMDLLGVGQAESLLARRRRDDKRRRAVLMFGAAALGFVTLIAVIGLALSRGQTSGRPAANSGVDADAGAVTAQAGRAAASATADPRVRFAAELAEVRRLTAVGDAGSLELAVAALERIRTESTPTPKPAPGTPGVDTKFLDNIEKAIEATRAKLDDAKLTEALAETQKKPPSEK